MKIPSNEVAIPVIQSPKVALSAASSAKLVPDTVTPNKPRGRKARALPKSFFMRIIRKKIKKENNM